MYFNSIYMLRFPEDKYEDFINIYINELPDCPFLKEQEKVIYTAAILHDMCDKKYVNEDEGIRQIEDFLQESMDPAEIDMTITDCP